MEGTPTDSQKPDTVESAPADSLNLKCHGDGAAHRLRDICRLGGCFGPEGQPEKPTWPVSPRRRDPSEFREVLFGDDVSPYRPPRASSLKAQLWSRAHLWHGEEDDKEDEAEKEGEGHAMRAGFHVDAEGEGGGLWNPQ